MFQELVMGGIVAGDDDFLARDGPARFAGAGLPCRTKKASKVSVCGRLKATMEARPRRPGHVGNTSTLPVANPFQTWSHGPVTKCRRNPIALATALIKSTEKPIGWPSRSV